MAPLQAQIRVDSEFDLTDTLIAGAEAVRQRFQATCAVDSGYMRDSASVLIGGRNLVVVYVAADYASFVENGTRKMRAQPALNPALDFVLPGLFAELARQEAALYASRRTLAPTAQAILDFVLGKTKGEGQ